MRFSFVFGQATHIFDGLERWPTHIMFLSGGTLKVWKRAEEIPELASDQLLQLAEKCVIIMHSTITKRINTLLLRALLAHSMESGIWIPDSRFQRLYVELFNVIKVILLAARWLREEKELRKTAKANEQGKGVEKPKVATWSNGWAPGRMTSTLKDSSNAVLRM